MNRKINFILFIFLFTKLLCGYEMTIAAPEPFLFEGIINPMTGQCQLNAIDLETKGAATISLLRTYIAPSIPDTFFKIETENQKKKDVIALAEHLDAHYRGWIILPHLSLGRSKGGITTVTTHTGIELPYSGEKGLLCSSCGMSNFNGIDPSATHDERNGYIWGKSSGTFHFQTPEGIIRTYCNGLLHKERLLNGKILRYHYQNKELIRIDSMDPFERYVYNSLFIDACSIRSDTGQQVDYFFDNRALEIQFYETTGRTWYGRKIKEKIEHASDHLLLTGVTTPSSGAQAYRYSEHFNLISSNGAPQSLEITYAPSLDSVLRVHQVTLGTNTYHFVYDLVQAGIKGGATHVFFPDGSWRKYTYNEQLLCTCIAQFQSDGHCIISHEYQWDDRQWLASEVIRDNRSSVVYERYFEYDAYGNPILEVIWNHGIHSQIQRRFSKDGLHLVLHEKHQDGVTIDWTYLPGTNLVLSKATSLDGVTIEQACFTYDDYNNLIAQQISTPQDSRITRYTLRQSAPFLHMPQIIHEWNGTEKHLSYDAWGNICKEDLYDENGHYHSTHLYEYDAQGHLIAKSISIIKTLRDQMPLDA